MVSASRRVCGLLFVALIAPSCRATMPSPTPPALPSTATASVPPLATRTALPTPVDPQSWLAANLDRVSQERLMADIEALAAIPTRHVGGPGIGVAADYIAAGLAAAGAQVSLDEFPLEFHQFTATPANVVGVIPGSDPEAGAILLGAHYDSRTADIDDWLGPAPGANDNATGVAVLMEVARLFSSYQPRATVYFVAFAAEETGLQGSRHFVESGAAEEVRAMIAFDIVGNSSGPSGSNALRVFSAGPEDSPSRSLARWLARLASEWTPPMPVLVQDAIDRPGRYSDHVPFTESGVPSVRFIEESEHTEWQHNSLDTVDRVDPSYLRSVAQLALAAAVTLAQEPDAFE